MTPDDRAVAWLDAHPEIVEAGGLSLLTMVFDEAWDELDIETQIALGQDARSVLVAFLTSPLPCARCNGLRVVAPASSDEWRDGGSADEEEPVVCPDCTDGTYSAVRALLARSGGVTDHEEGT